MKIDSSKNSGNLSELANKDEKKNDDIPKIKFGDKLKMFSDKNTDEKIQLLVEKIIEQGEKLSKKIDIKELKQYKLLISEFMEETIHNSHKFTKEEFLDRRGRHRVYAVIKNVNKELDELTKDVLSSEKDNIKILNRLEDIRGLVMDLLL
ncbi:MAG: YaaR family protein [Clostridiales bacterium]